MPLSKTCEKEAREQCLNDPHGAVTFSSCEMNRVFAQLDVERGCTETMIKHIRQLAKDNQNIAVKMSHNGKTLYRTIQDWAAMVLGETL